MRAIPWLFVLPVLALVAGCFDEEVPPGTQIACATNADCPTGYLCRTTLGRCAPSDSLDQTPPALVGDPKVAPALAKAGSTVTVEFEVSEALAGDPAVHLLDRLLSLDEAGTDRAGRTYRYRYVVARDEPEGSPVPLTIDLVDPSGNPALGLSAGNALFDFTPPALVSATPVTPSAVAQGVEARVTFAFNEPLSVDPVVTMAPASGEPEPRPWSLVSAEPSGSYTFAYVPAGDEREGAWQVSAVATDLAGNACAPASLSAVALDFHAPRVDAVGVEPESRRVRPGQIAQVTVSLDEPAATLPLLAGADADAGKSIAFELVRVTGATLVFQRAVAQGEDGDYALTLSGAADGAGNDLAPLEVARLVVDGTPPALSGFTQSAATLNGHDTLVVEFSSTEPLREPPLVKLGGWALTREGAGEAPYRYSLSLAGTGALGSFDVQVAMTDLAGNGALVEPGVVQADAVAPGLIDAQFSPPVARLSITAYLTVTTTERLEAEPVLEFAAPGGDPGFTFVTRAGQSYTYALPITARVAPGVYRLARVSMVDQAGNAADADPGAVGLVVDFTVDNEPPQVTDLLLSAARFSAQSGFDQVGVSFGVSKPLDPDGGLEVLVGTSPATCAASAGGFQCQYTVLGTEPEGPILVKVTARDRAGNTGYESAGATLDFTAPRLVDGTALLELSPAPGSLVPTVRAPAAGATARLFFMTDEPVGSVPEVKAAAPSPDPATDLPFAWAGGAFHQGITTWCSFRHTLDAASAHPQGPYAVEARVVDEVGNASGFGVALDAPGLVVDTQPPSPLTAGQLEGLLFRRMPWGTAESAGAPRFSVAQTTPGVLEPWSTLLVWAGPDTRTAREIGRTSADAAGDAAEARLLQEDRTAVYLSQVDAAGQLDSPVATRLRRVDWYATAGGKVPGSDVENPHRFLSRAVMDDDLSVFGRPGVTEEAGAALALTDGLRATQPGAGRGRQRGPVAATPAGRIAQDHARGRLVAYAGGPEVYEWDGGLWQATSPADPEGDGNPGAGLLVYADPLGEVLLVAVPDVWAWNGQSWRRLPLSDPEGDGSPTIYAGSYAVAYDPSRARLVLFGGGFGIFANGDTWEWTGASWVRVVPADPEGDGNPEARSFAAMAYDGARGTVVLFGGHARYLGQLADTWEWDGTSWRRQAPADPEADGNPAGRSEHSLSFDRRRGTVVLQGGNLTGAGTGPCDDGTWEYDGASWKRLVATDPEGDGNPPALCSAPLAYDPDGGRTILLGAATWALEGSSWRNLSADPEGDGDPSARENPAAVWDGARGRVVLFGGQDVDYLPNGETWEWGGTSWRRMLPTDPGGDGDPSPRYRHAMAFDSLRGVAVLFGGQADAGYSDETWEWNGVHWRLVVPTDPEGDGNPAARRRLAMAYDAARGVTVLFGGNATLVGTVGDTWEYDGVSWRQIATTDPEGDGDPNPRNRHAMAWDAARGKVVLFGGQDATPGTYSDETWEYDGTSWRRAVPVDPEGDGNPPGLQSMTLTYDQARGTTVLVGGLDWSVTYEADLWEWNGVSWRRLAVAPTPPERYVHATAYDALRDRLLVFGGNGNSGQLGDTWELDLGASLSPGQTFSVPLGAAGLEAGTELLAVGASFVAGASGFGAGQPLDGVSLQAWSIEGWRELAVNADASVPGAAIGATIGGPAQLMQVNLLGGFHFAVRARGTNGTGQAQVATDYAEAHVSYRLP